MTSCVELEDEEDEEKEKQEDSTKGDDKTLIIVEVLPARMGWSKSFAYQKRCVSVLSPSFTTRALC